MANIKNLERLVAKLQAKAAKAVKEDKAVGLVGYTQSYGIYVHENLEANHPIGQAKFLEQPLKENVATYRKIIETAVKAGVPVPQAILMACLRLLRDSQALCPIDTGALRASGYTKLEYE